MNLLKRSGTYQLRKRVPRRYASIEDRGMLWISLHTDSESVAREKAATIWREMIEAWELKLSGAGAQAEERIRAARDLASRRGYRFMAPEDVSRLPLEKLLARIESIVTSKGRIDMIEAEAAIGAVPKAELPVSRALERYWVISKGNIRGKSDDQIRRWKNPRIKAVENFIRVVGDVPIDQITTYDILQFRDWWLDRIASGDVGAGSANKDLIHLFAMIKDVARAADLELRFKTEKMMLDEGKKGQRPAFSVDWIKTKFLAPGALPGLNNEARAILIGMVNTGYRPSEGSMLTAAQIRLDGPYPHIRIEAVGRTLKSHNAERTIPLCGVSLDAFRGHCQTKPA